MRLDSVTDSVTEGSHHAFDEIMCRVIKETFMLFILFMMTCSSFIHCTFAAILMYPPTRSPMQVLNRWIISLSDWIAATKGMFDMNLTAARLLRNIHIARMALGEVRQTVAQSAKKRRSPTVDAEYYAAEPVAEMEDVTGADPLYHSSVQFEVVGLFDLLQCSMKRAFEPPVSVKWTRHDSLNLQAPQFLISASQYQRLTNCFYQLKYRVCFGAFGSIDFMVAMAQPTMHIHLNTITQKHSLIHPLRHRLFTLHTQ